MGLPRGVSRVRSFGPDGTIITEDGRELQAVVTRAGSLGAVSKTNEDRESALDQSEDQRSWPPTYESLGLDQ